MQRRLDAQEQELTRLRALLPPALATPTPPIPASNSQPPPTPSSTLSPPPAAVSPANPTPASPPTAATSSNNNPPTQPTVPAGTAPPSSNQSAPKPPAKHPLLPPKDRARPSRNLASHLGLPATSATDLVLNVTLPASYARHALAGKKLPFQSNASSAHVFKVGSLLAHDLGIMAPRLPQMYSQHNTTPSLLTAMGVQLGGTPAVEVLGPLHTTLSESVNLDHTGADLGARLLSIDSLADKLLALKLPALKLHTEWHHYLNTTTTQVLRKSIEQNAVQHIVLRLGFNTPLVALAVRAHLQRYVDWMGSTPAAPSPSAITAINDARQQQWTAAAVKRRALPTKATLADYTLRYVTTKVTGWTRGSLDSNSAPGQYYAYDEVCGNTAAVRDFIRTVAPHCTCSDFTEQQGGIISVQFVHLPEHYCELFSLLTRTSPEHGINRPLKHLRLFQSKSPTMACSLCGQPNHRARDCPNVAQSAAAHNTGNVTGDLAAQLDMEEVYSERTAVCRLCYAVDHQGTCFTPSDQQHCKICNAAGHTSFRCKQYLPSWIPLTPPASTNPRNPHGLTVWSQQTGLPLSQPYTPGSSSTMAWNIARPPLFSPADFPSLPSRSPPSPTASTASGASSSTSEPNSAGPWPSTPAQSHQPPLSAPISPSNSTHVDLPVTRRDLLDILGEFRRANDEMAQQTAKILQHIIGVLHTLIPPPGFATGLPSLSTPPPAALIQAAHMHQPQQYLLQSTATAPQPAEGVPPGGTQGAATATPAQPPTATTSSNPPAAPSPLGTHFSGPVYGTLSYHNNNTTVTSTEPSAPHSTAARPPAQQ